MNGAMELFFRELVGEYGPERVARVLLERLYRNCQEQWPLNATWAASDEGIMTHVRGWLSEGDRPERVGCPGATHGQNRGADCDAGSGPAPQPPVILFHPAGKKLVIDHSTHPITLLGEDALGGEVQPIVNMRPINKYGRVVESHIVLIPNASSLQLSWHPAYVWPGNTVYIPSDGMDMVTVVMDRDGRMLSTVTRDFQ